MDVEWRLGLRCCCDLTEILREESEDIADAVERAGFDNHLWEAEDYCYILIDGFEGWSPFIAA